MVSRRRAFRLLGLGSLGIGAGLLGGGCRVTTGTPPISEAGMDKKPAPGRRTNIEIYSIFGGTTGQGMTRLAREFERTHPDIGVRVVYAPNTAGDVQQKLFVAIAGGNPPDVAQIVPSRVPQWSELGIMTDLTDRFRAAGLTERDFLAPSWQGMTHAGKVWQLHWDVDPNFPFFWNKDLFERAGLDPDRPPETFEEFDEYSAKLLEKHGANVVRIGAVPWDWYGFSNSMFTIGFSFGGEFYDPATERAIADHPRNVEALEWLVRYARRVGGPSRVAVTPPSLQLHVFASGNVAMAPLVAANLADIREHQPDLPIGVGQLPYAPPADGPGSGAWIGGWGMFVPSEAREPDAAWEFIRWVSATEEGTRAQWEHVGFPPSWTKSSVLAEMESDPMWRPYHQVLTNSTRIRPASTVSDFYFAALEAEVSAAVNGTKSARRALADVTEATNIELERFAREVG